MIIYVGPRRQTALIRAMRRDPRLPPLAARTYAWLYRTPRLPAATYVFLGIDRLDAAERRLAGSFFRHINAAGPGFRALNNPARALGRYRLLRTLHDAGINRFNAWLAADSGRPASYPVFIRRNTQSTPPLTGLIETAAALEAELTRLIASGEPADDLLIIEYCTEPWRPGLFRRLACLRLGERLVPRAVLVNTDWMVKHPNPIVLTEAENAWDRGQILDNPFAETLKRAFDLAHIDYGRADFGLVDGQPQIYEINFNPDLRIRWDHQTHPDPAREANFVLSDELGFAALRDLDQPGSGSIDTLHTDELAAFRWRFWRNYAPQRY